MKLPVLVEPVPGKGFVARIVPSFSLSAEGATADEAVMNLQAEVRAAEIEMPALSSSILDPRVQQMLVKEPPGEHPILKWAGTWDPNDPVIDEWLKIIKENREALDNDPDAI
jgi:hypothetical protein